jgi:crotonobetainyl-CoA hydratase
MPPPFRLTRRDHVLALVLDRPKANAIDRATSVALGEAFVAFRDDPNLRVAIVTGAGDRFFSAGWDLKAGAEGEHERMDYGPGGFAGLTELFDLAKPVIAAVNGLAIGGGFELALAADLILAADHAEFALPEGRIGNVADAGGVQRLPRRLPYAIAMEMLFTGRRMGAAEAARWGLVNAVVPAAELPERAWSLARTIAEAAPLSIQATKEVVRETAALGVRDAFRAVREGRYPTYERMLGSADRREGILAFSEKREPRFQGG